MEARTQLGQTKKKWTKPSPNDVLRAINKWQRSEFRYGTKDCCQFAAFIVNELTGKDYSADFDYDSEEQAQQIVEEHGDLVGLFTDILGEDDQDVFDGSPCIAFIHGIGQFAGIKYKDSVICVTKNGIARVPNSNIIAGWNLCLQ